MDRDRAAHTLGRRQPTQQLQTPPDQLFIGKPSPAPAARRPTGGEDQPPRLARTLQTGRVLGSAASTGRRPPRAPRPVAGAQREYRRRRGLRLESARASTAQRASLLAFGNAARAVLSGRPRQAHGPARGSANSRRSGFRLQPRPARVQARSRLRSIAKFDYHTPAPQAGYRSERPERIAPGVAMLLHIPGSASRHG